jgi:hypothetical protein
MDRGTSTDFTMVDKNEDFFFFSKVTPFVATTMNVTNKSNIWFIANRQPVHQLHTGILSTNFNLSHVGFGSSELCSLI